MRNEILDNLKFLLSSAEEQGTEQGVKTYSHYIDQLSCDNCESSVYESLHQTLSGMQRFASFNSKEWQSIHFILEATQTFRKPHNKLLNKDS
ncbi:hypothetical protein [uncultured Vibrio sp.]|uniref:hypothetical protein n=1 Tax=uncultured Vibrio sp. TaxID=114054 RepID=UPI0025E3A439|nr:hypothetical protein [uncultured Vibrio sp.]